MDQRCKWLLVLDSTLWLLLIVDYVVQVEAEAVILATGYHYNFPFLTPECGVSVENRVVQPLYKHLISIASPSLAFIGLPVQVIWKLNVLKTKFFPSDLPLPPVWSSSKCSAPNLDLVCCKLTHLNQVRYFIKTLLGDAKLPSAAEMERDTQVNFLSFQDHLSD